MPLWLKLVRVSTYTVKLTTGQHECDGNYDLDCIKDYLGFRLNLGSLNRVFLAHTALQLPFQPNNHPSPGYTHTQSGQIQRRTLGIAW